MKKILSVIIGIILTVVVSGQEKESKTKTGWRFDGALPATTYDSNLGFQYGALVEFRNYGNPSVYPEFLDHTYTEISHFTKGSGIFRMMYESYHLIPGIHSTTDLSYLPDAATDFYGFNGYESVYNSDWMKYDKETGPADPYISAMFYRLKRNQFRFKNDFQGKLAGEHIKWSAGFALNNFQVGSINIDKLNKGREYKLPQVSEDPGLYELYRDSLGLISENEADGGWVNTLKAGIEWDSRDSRANPMKGLWTEMGIEVAPGFIGNDWTFSRFYITHRQYFTLIPNNLSFVYRLGFQTTLGDGKVPFFYQSQVITSMLTGATNEGLGGSATLRGVLRNRVLGNGITYGNFELRWKPVHFRLFNKDSYLGVNFFYDMGIVTKNIAMPDNLRTTFDTKMKNYTYSDFFNPGAEKLHQSAGISIMPVWGQNFVIAIDIGKSFNKQDGNIGFSVGLNYLF
ncbi:MAG: BamA/TamA family outer membrane protein [Bacteroidetes bacterium]|nr:BamA/TamA family outer membrane protein [Bacteroidota bacterium]